MKLNCLKTSLCLFLLLPVFALSGEGWVGSGGELFKDAHNPWFIKSTKEIRYCIVLDKVSISAELEIIEGEVLNAFNYWQNEFKKSGQTIMAGRFNLGGQNIIKENCNDKTDLVFKLGYGTLTKPEILHLESPEKYIGVTIRKKYSTEILRGSGIIYISSDLGKHQYENLDGNLISKAWSRPKLLRFALIHELGHVFGIPHSGNSIMSQIFLDQILNKYLVENFIQLPVESFLQPDKELESCTIERKIKTFVFRLKSTEDCVKIVKIDEGKFKLFAVSNKKEVREIGKIDGVYPELWDLNSKPGSILQITKDQKVFTPTETGFRNFMYGPVIEDQGYRGTLMINGTLPKSIYLKIRSNSFAIYGEYKKKIEPLMVKQSPLSLLLLKDPIQ
jgi:hypothetical protein